MKRAIFLLYCILSVTSCNKPTSSTEEGGGSSPKYIAIDPIIQSRATEYDFEANDQIGLSVIMGDNTAYISNSPLDYDGKMFNSTLEWYSDDSKRASLVAYYPYVQGDQIPTTFTVKADQSSEESYAASDLMAAYSSDIKPSSVAVTMAFKHLLSKIVAKIDNRAEQGVKSVTISGTYPTATVDAAELTLVADQSSDKADILTMHCDEDTYKAVIVPQSAALTFTVTLNDGSTLKSEEDIQLYEVGKGYTADILVFDGNSLEITISSGINQWEDGDDIEIIDKPSMEEHDGYFIYDGQRYNTKTFDGITVMIDNLRYIPKGMKASIDPADQSGLWYPYALSPDPKDPEADYIAKPLTDSKSVEEYGYLYNFATAFGVDVTGENYNTFEGTQGICPEGWHIPTRGEWHSLCGDGMGAPSDNAEAPFYDTKLKRGSIQLANELGFNHTYAGSITNDKYSVPHVEKDYTESSTSQGGSTESIVGKNSTTYYISSTSQYYWPESDKAVFYALFTSHASIYADKGAISVMLCNEPFGATIRCIKDNN